MTAQYRANPFGDPVIVAAGRAARPRSADGADVDAVRAGDSAPHHDETCPFCTGNETQTPPEVDAIRPDDSAPDTPGWRARTVPNLYPAFRPDERADEWSGPLLHQRRGARGRHEVAIHSPDHAGRLARIDPQELATAMTLWQRRLDAHRDEGWTSTVLAVNEGHAAGASLAHPHAQLFATDTVPVALADELRRQDDWSDDRGSALLGDVVAAEADGPRFVDRCDDLVAWSPYWAQVPFEVWIAAPAPDGTGGRFAASPQMAGAAELLGRVCRRIASAAGDPALNVVLRDPPHAGSRSTWWHLRVVPRTSIAAGWELASGIRIVTTAPEDAAALLRDAAV